MTGESQICKFYENQNVLVTGGTGFLGKILIEKLLRSTDIATIYILIREKKGKNVHARLDEIFDNVIFDRLRHERPKFRHRVVAIPGDCSITGLGLTITDRQKLISEINVVFHGAATVRFDENLKLAYSINVNGTRDVIELCRQMKSLKVLMHISTAYSNCHLKCIGERFYDYPVDYETVGGLLEKVTKSEADKLTNRVKGEWPNTYSFTKALAESLIRTTADNIPVGIYRPAIVTSTYKEPIENWIDNLYGATGAAAGAVSGVLRVFPCDKTSNAEIVPVDTCVAGLIAAAWDVANRNKDDSKIPIYNYVSSVENPLSWGEYLDLNMMHGIKYPLLKGMWTIMFWLIKNRSLYLLMRFLLHLVPALMLDGVAVVTGRKPRFVSMYGKIHKFSDVIAFFGTQDWKFENDNTRALWEKMNQTDRSLFPMSMTTVLWTYYLRNYIKGIRVYLLKDPMSTLEKARSRKFKFDIAHECLKALWYFLVVTLVWMVIFRVRDFFMGDRLATDCQSLRDSFTQIN